MNIEKIELGGIRIESLRECGGDMESCLMPRFLAMASGHSLF